MKRHAWNSDWVRPKQILLFGRTLITGDRGSGKTTFVLKNASKLSLQGRTVGIMCQNIIQLRMHVRRLIEMLGDNVMNGPRQSQSRIYLHSGGGILFFSSSSMRGADLRGIRIDDFFWDDFDIDRIEREQIANIDAALSASQEPRFVFVQDYQSRIPEEIQFDEIGNI